MKTLHVVLLALLGSGIGVKGADVSDLTYVNNTVYITITKCEKNARGVLEIPATIEGLPVKIIENSAFSECYNLSKITIPDSVTSIKRSAFRNCYGLTSINLPDSITSIGITVFAGSGLSSVTIPDSVTSIEQGAFQSCPNLTSITIPDSVREIGWSAFISCANLRSVTIGKGVTTIGRQAFLGCPRLVRIEFKGNAPEYEVFIDFIQGAVVFISSSATGFNKDISGIPVVVLDDPIDSDNDGVPDVDDAFPNDPTEVADSDNDGVGDNADARSGEVIIELQGQIALLQAQVSELSKGQTLEEIQDGRLGSIVITPNPNTNTAILSLDIEQSNDLKTWTLYRKILESIPMPEGKKFYRFALDK